MSYNTPTLRSRRNGRPAVRLRPPARGPRVTAAEARAALSRRAEPEPKDVGELADRMEEDPQIAFACTFLTAQLRVTPVTCVAENEGDPRAVELAAALVRLWERHVPQIFAAFGRGRAAFAVEWEFDRGWNLHLPKLHQLPFDQSRPLWDEDSGEFLGIEIVGADDLTLEPPRCWHCPTDADATHPHGRSRFLGAPRAEWERRQQLFNLFDEHVEHFALRGGTAYGPDKFNDENGQPTIDATTNMQLAHRARRPGTLMYLPGERGQDGRFPVEFVEPPSLDPPGPIDAALAASDIRTLRALGISELSVQQTGDVGSYALSVVHRMILLSIVYELAAQWGGGFARYVCGPAARFNLGIEGGVRFETPRLADLPDSAAAELAKTVLTQPNLSPVLAALDIRRIIEGAGIKVPDDFEEKLAANMAAQQRLAAIGSLAGAGSGSGFQSPDAAAMADDLAPQRLDPDATPAGVPSLDAFWATVGRELDRIMDQVVALLVERPDRAWLPVGGVPDLFRRADELIDAAAAAASLIGRAAIPVPAPPRRLPSAVALDNSVADEPRSPTADWRWPWQKELVRWLRDRRLLTPEEFRALAREDRPRNVSVPSVSSPETLRSLQSKLADAIAEGLPPREFRERAKGIADVPRHEAETLVRTATKQGYLDGKQATLSKPHVAAAFPYDLIVTTRDTRVRETHKPLDGLILRRGSAAHAEAMRLLSDYNCRCDAIPLSEERARAEAAKPGRRMADALPEEATAS